MSEQKIPYFQQLQQQFSAHIRNPKENAYAPENEKPIEARRLTAYQELFFNNIEGFFSQIFPVCVDVLGKERWLEILREYMIKHNAQTPLFHELGEEFLLFLESEFEPKENDPHFLLELAHYEWVELALSVSTEEGFEGGGNNVENVNIDLAYQLSPVAWPLAYEWPVHQLSSDFQPKKKPNTVTTLLVYRHLESDQNAFHNTAQNKEMIDFMTLTPMLYQFLLALESAPSARIAFETLAKQHELNAEQLEGSAQKILQKLLALNVLRSIPPTN